MSIACNLEKVYKFKNIIYIMSKLYFILLAAYYKILVYTACVYYIVYVASRDQRNRPELSGPEETRKNKK